MSAGNLFSALTSGGVYFNKKKYADDLALFKKADGSSTDGPQPKDGQGKGKAKRRGDKASDTTTAGSSIAALPPELDFFGSSSGSRSASSAAAKADQKRKRSQHDEDDNAEEEEDEDEARTQGVTDGSAQSVSLSKKKSKTASVHQRVLFVGSEQGKLHALRQLVVDGEIKPPVLMLVQSVQRAQDLYAELAYDNLRVDVLHQDQLPHQRKVVLERFQQGQVWVLIATDKAMKAVKEHTCNLVLSYDFPQSAQSYTDRIARTGRPGKEGKAVTLFTKEDRPYLKIVVNVMKVSGSTDIPQWLLDLPNLSKNERRKLRRRAPERTDVKDAAGTSKLGRREASKRAEMVAGSKRRREKGVERRRPSSKKVKVAADGAGEEDAAQHGDDDDDDDDD